MNIRSVVFQPMKRMHPKIKYLGYIQGFLDGKEPQCQHEYWF